VLFAAAIGVVVSIGDLGAGFWNVSGQRGSMGLEMGGRAPMTTTRDLGAFF